MKQLLAIPFLIVVISSTPSGDLNEYLLSRTFSYELGLPTLQVDNMIVHGKTDVAREIKFINDSLFQEIISNETRLYDNHLADTSGFVSMKNGYEISVLSGSWINYKDTLLVLHYYHEKIYEMSAYIRHRYYTEKEQNQEQEIQELRSREWKETKRFSINSERNLCIVDGLSRCYKPSY